MSVPVLYGEIEQQKFSQLTCCLSVCDGEVRYGMSALHTKTKINGNFRKTSSQSTCSLKSSKKKNNHTIKEYVRKMYVAQVWYLPLKSN